MSEGIQWQRDGLCGGLDLGGGFIPTMFCDEANETLYKNVTTEEILDVLKSFNRDNALDRMGGLLRYLHIFMTYFKNIFW